MSLQTVHLPGPAPRQDSSPFDSLFGTPAFLQAHGLSFSKDCTAIPNPVFHSDASRVTGADNSDVGNGGDREGDPASSRGTPLLCLDAFWNAPDVSSNAKPTPTTVSSKHSYVASATYRDVYETWSSVWLPTAEHHKMLIPTTPMKRHEQFAEIGTHSFLVCAQFVRRNDNSISIPVLMVLGCPTLSTCDVQGSPWADGVLLPPSLDNRDPINDYWDPNFGTLSGKTRLHKDWKSLKAWGVEEYTKVGVFGGFQRMVPC